MVNGDTVVITGGDNTREKVSVYSVQGWQEDLPELNIGRLAHACAAYTTASYEHEFFLGVEFFLKYTPEKTISP